MDTKMTNLDRRIQFTAAGRITFGHMLGLFIIFWCIAVLSAIRPAGTSSAMHCEYYNETLCNSNSNGIGCNGTEECKPSENEKGNLCYVLWQNTSTGFALKLKGCWVGNPQDCSEKTRCMETRRDPRVQLLFCCCEGEMCNRPISRSPPILPIQAPTVGKPTTTVPIKMATTSVGLGNIVMYTILPLLGVALIAIVVFWWYRHHKMAHFNELPTSDPSPLPPPSPLLGLQPIQLLEVKAQGRFASVWKAQILGEHVAVKIFPSQDKSSWMTEQEIYRLSQMKHENVLAFIGGEKREDNFQVEYWMITAYHDKGSLCDFLKANTVTWEEVLNISDSIAKGLTHLHEELPPTKCLAYKPSVAHRDFKSKNVLIKSNMTACIADFGLALVFHQNENLGDTHGQVGTRRYMSPEVLEGAINFNRDSFLRIDMYACGLVMWELIARCSDQKGPVDEYSLPFEEIVGQHPTLEDMQEVVSHKKIRPKFKEHWKLQPDMAAYCDTIEECWDHDAEARLSASCVLERISFLCRNHILNLDSQPVTGSDTSKNSTTSCTFPT